MFEQALRWLQDALTVKGVRRALWLFLVLTVLFVGFEAQTNFFEINTISRRLDLLERASQQPLTPEQTARIEKLKNGVLEDLEVVQEKRANPFRQFLGMAVRFVKGAWVTFPLFWAVIKIALFFLRQNQSDDHRVKGMMVYFGWLGLAAVAWITTMLGVNSVLWNSSQNFLVSWFVFPMCSAVALVIVIVWVMLLRALLPKEQKQPASSPAKQEQT